MVSRSQQRLRSGVALRRDRLVALFTAALVIVGTFNARAQDKADPVPSAANQPARFAALPPPDALTMMVRSSLLALAHANETGNYTVLRDLGAPAFQTANTAAKLSAIFTDLRERNIDLSGIAYLAPQMTDAPTITPQGLLSISGSIPSRPAALTFQLSYQVVGPRWRLFGIAVNPAPMVAAATPMHPSSIAVSANGVPRTTGSLHKP